MDSELHSKAKAAMARSRMDDSAMERMPCSGMERMPSFEIFDMSMSSFYIYFKVISLHRIAWIKSFVM